MSTARDGEWPAVLDVRYGEGWDAERREVVGEFGEAEARRRDEAGEQYAVVLSAPDRHVPHRVVHVAWGQHYMGVWSYDERGRRIGERDLRRLKADALFYAYEARWRYDTPGMPEFASHAWRWQRRLRPRAGGWETCEPEGDGGGLLQSSVDVAEEEQWSPVPAFGDWGPLVGVPDGVELRRFGDSALPSASFRRGTWTPPVFRRPRFLDSLFVAGSRFSTGCGTAVCTVLEPENIGNLRMPTGRLVVADPDQLLGWRPEAALLVSVPPGDYPVQLVRLEWQEAGCVHEGVVREVAAARLLIKPTPTVAWELAVRPEEDLRILRHDEYFGFGVDSGMGCFVDEAGREPLGARYEGPLEGGDFLLLENEELEADLIAFRSGRGDGHYPVWIGRDDDGCVTSFVADMRILPDEEMEVVRQDR